MDANEFQHMVTRYGYKFLDFGTSQGGSIKYAYETFEGSHPGLGIDIDPSKVDTARQKGHDSVVFDILSIPDGKLVEFVTMSHFLEHLPSVLKAELYLRKAVRIARRFVFIRQPFFDADGWLAQRGFKLYWSDWPEGHQNKMTTLDFYLMLKQMKSEGLIKAFSIHFQGEIATSDNKIIHSLESPTGQHAYQSSIHPPKKLGVALQEVFKEIFVLVCIGKQSWDCFSKLQMDKTVLTIE